MKWWNNCTPEWKNSRDVDWTFNSWQRTGSKPTKRLSMPYTPYVPKPIHSAQTPHSLQSFVVRSNPDRIILSQAMGRPTSFTSQSVQYRVENGPAFEVETCFRRRTLKLYLTPQWDRQCGDCSRRTGRRAVFWKIGEKVNIVEEDERVVCCTSRITVKPSNVMNVCQVRGPMIDKPYMWATALR